MSTDVFKQRKDIDEAFKALSQCIQSAIPRTFSVTLNKHSVVMTFTEAMDNLNMWY